MQIGKILYPVKTLGPFDRVGIWTLGCNKKCKGCANPELRIEDSKKEIDIKSVIDFIIKINAKHVTISGGEPFLQSKEVKRFIEELYKIGIDDILIYSGYTLDELKSKKDSDINYILSKVAALIDGPFIQELYQDMPLRGSTNQNVIIINKKYEKAINEFLNLPKKIQIFNNENEVHFIGIPIKDYHNLYVKYAEEIKNE